MNGKLPFVYVLADREKHRRRQDLTSFEYSYEAEITNVYPLTERERLYQIQISDPDGRRTFSFRPGQFLMLELPGIGEAPFSISSSPVRQGSVELCIRSVGNLTNFLSRVSRGTKVGIQGPFGTHFPLEDMEGEDIVLVAGGLGIVPLRSPVLTVLANRSRYGRVDVIYGVKKHSGLLFTYQFDEWRRFDIGLEIVVENADDEWKGNTGYVTDILRRRLEAPGFEPARTWAVVCGPPVMFNFVCSDLRDAGVPMQKMFVSLERRMHCGRGKCCRCNIGSTYTCLAGPVFDYWSVTNLKEAI